MNKPRVLFVCIHNSSRSQMAEGFLRSLCGDCFEAHSAGLEAGQLNPLAVEAMAQAGIDISRQWAKPISEFRKAGTRFDWVITVCDETSAERCPVFPGDIRREHWSFPDPSAFVGSHEERLKETARVRDAIRARIKEWCAIACPTENAGR